MVIVLRRFFYSEFLFSFSCWFFGVRLELLGFVVVSFLGFVGLLGCWGRILSFKNKYLSSMFKDGFFVWWE